MSNRELRERKYKKINRILLIPIGIITGYCILQGIENVDSYAAIQGMIALVMYTFPVLIAHVIGFPIPQDCRLLYYMFTFSTMVVGSALYGYSSIPYWDKIVHFVSGILISAVGLLVCQLLFMTLKGEKKVRCILYTLFPFLFNLSIAGLWEVYEYMLYILLGIDAVNHLTTGVHDTIQDIMVCIGGGILFSCIIWRAFYRKKYGFMIGVCRHFFDLRGQSLEFDTSN